MSKTQFKAESKKLLDLMINSIYTNREIFLRELLSNASDAIDKLHFKSLTDSEIKSNFSIFIEIDKQNRQLIIKDDGIGMTEKEFETNLGTIAKSDSLNFKTENDKTNIIGQFGVGFYSAFMVAKKVIVKSKAYGETKGFCWESEGADGYNVSPVEVNDIGTTVILTLKDDTEEENYSEFLDEFKIKALVKKYSDYLCYPIKMECEHSRKKEGAKENDENSWETYKTVDILNSITPIWKKNKKEISPEEINDFYKNKFEDFSNPAKVIHFKTEGVVTFASMLFIPSNPPYDYYTKNFKKGLALYSSGVLIKEKCEELIADHYSFVKGLVDSEDVSLNISREMLQQNRQLQVIAKNVNKKINSELSSWLKNNRKEYETFFNNFGLQLKYGIYSSFGANKDELKDLILFKSTHNNEFTTLSEYVSRMQSNQKDIFYACGESIEKINQLPQMEFIKSKNIEVLYFINEIDEFAIKMLQQFEEKNFKNITSKDANFETEQEKKENEEKNKQHTNLLTKIKENLKDVISDVKLSNKLGSTPVCISTDGDVSLGMEKILNAMPSNNKVKANKVLLINPNHAIFNKLCDLEKQNNAETLKEYSKLLFDLASLIEGISPKNPVELCNRVSKLLTN